MSLDDGFGSWAPVILDATGDLDTPNLHDGVLMSVIDDPDRSEARLSFRTALDELCELRLHSVGPWVLTEWRPSLYVHSACLSSGPEVSDDALAFVMEGRREALLGDPELEAARREVVERRKSLFLLRPLTSGTFTALCGRVDFRRHTSQDGLGKPSRTS